MRNADCARSSYMPTERKRRLNERIDALSARMDQLKVAQDQIKKQKAQLKLQRAQQQVRDAGKSGGSLCFRSPLHSHFAKSRTTLCVFDKPAYEHFYGQRRPLGSNQITRCSINAIVTIVRLCQQQSIDIGCPSAQVKALCVCSFMLTS